MNPTVRNPLAPAPDRLYEASGSPREAALTQDRGR
jgi:hypothetical protein